MDNEIDNKPNRFYILVLVAVFSFMFGWQAKGFGLFGSGPIKIEKTVDRILDKAEHADIDMTLFWKVWQLLEDKYVDTSVIQNDDMVYGSIKGMVNAIDDPFTVFMTTEESKQFMDGLEGFLND